jgi:hypothetical protein
MYFSLQPYLSVIICTNGFGKNFTIGAESHLCNWGLLKSQIFLCGPSMVLYRRENNSKVFIATPLIYPSHNLGYNNAELEHFLSFHLSSLLLAFDIWNPPGFFIPSFTALVRFVFLIC